MIGIVVLNFNTPYDTIDCVKSIIVTTKCKFKIYIVDNCSSDSSYDILIKEYSGIENVTVIRAHENGGYSYGNNIGIKAALDANCNYILISNPDVIYYDNAIDSLLKTLINNSKIGVVGPSCASLDEDESQLFRKVYNNTLYFFSKKPLYYLQRKMNFFRTEFNYTKINDNDVFIFEGMVRGCCFMLSSDLFCKIDLFDENIFLYCEEWILAKKLMTLGYKSACAFESKILHKEARSTKSHGKGFQSYHLYLSSFYYLKNYNKTSRFLLILIYVMNIASFSLKSVFDASYRKFLIKLVNKNFNLLINDRNINNETNKINM